MNYKISYSNSFTQYIDIEFSVEVNQPFTIINLPVWRPGRYELGNFAKNIQKFACYNEKGETLHCSKISKSSWKINTAKANRLITHYNYYAAELNVIRAFTKSIFKVNS